MGEKKTSPRVYGPVPSRRYGLSLGLDLLPGKVCSYDCVYCQVGRTRRLQIAREDFFSVERVLGEVDRALADSPLPDVITLAGSGDASLYRSLPELIAGLKARLDVPVVLLTNGGLLWRPEVRAAVRPADVLSPSLDAGDPETFRRINRPHPDITFDRMVDGLRATAAGRSGALRLEIMIVPGYNDGPDQLDALVKLAGDLDVDGIDLNTPVRPAPGRGDVRPMTPERLQSLGQRFGPRAQVIAGFERPEGAGRSQGPLGPDAIERVLAALGRRPCAVPELAASMGLDASGLDAALAPLCAQGILIRQERAGQTFYLLRSAATEQET